MNTDYTYCLSEKCIHRRGCKRALVNYSDDEVKELYTVTRFVSEISGEDCINSKPYPYANLDRFRNSDGTDLKE